MNLNDIELLKLKLLQARREALGLRVQMTFGKEQDRLNKDESDLIQAINDRLKINLNDFTIENKTGKLVPNDPASDEKVE